MLKAKVSKLNINIFTKMEHVLTQFTINIEELTLFPFNNINNLQLQYNTLNNNIINSNNNNNVTQNAACQIAVKNFELITHFTFLELINGYNKTNKANNHIDIYEIIKEGKGYAFNACNVIYNTSYNIDIVSEKFRFEKDDTNDKNNINRNNDFSAYALFETLNNNNFMNINIVSINFDISNTLITYAMLILDKIQREKTKRKKLLNSGKARLQRIVNKLKNYNNIKTNKGYKFITPSSSQARTYLTIIKILTYISLIMKQKKYIDFDLNFYLCEKLVNEYKHKIIGNDHFIIDYLIQDNIQSFLSSPPIAGGKHFFLNIDIFKDLKAPTINNTLKSFMIFILNKYILCKECIDNYKSYDDYFSFNININALTVNIIRDIPFTYDDDYTQNELYNYEDEYLNELECAVRCARRAYLKEGNGDEKELEGNLDILIQLKLSCIKANVYTNMRDDLLVKGSVLYIDVNDVCYRGEDVLGKVNGVGGGLKMKDVVTCEHVLVPLLKVEYNIEMCLYIINGVKCKFKMEVPNVVIVVDPFCVYFIMLFLQTILNSYTFLLPKLNTFFDDKHLITLNDISNQQHQHTFSNTSIHRHSNVTPPPQIQQQQHQPQKEGLFCFESFSIEVSTIVVNCSHTYLSTLKSEESIALKIVNVSYTNDTTKIALSINEIVMGSISSFNFINYLQYKKGIKFITTIFDLFDISHSGSFQQILNNNIVLPLSEIMIALNKRDINNIYKFITEVKTILKFMPIFDRNKTQPNTHNPNINDVNNINNTNINITNSILPNKNTDSIVNGNNNNLLLQLSHNENDILKYIAISITKISLHIDLTNDKNDKMVFKHIYIILSGLDFIFLQSPMYTSYLFSFESVKCSNRYRTQLKILEITRQKTIDRLMFTNALSTQTFINEICNSNNVKNNNETQYDSFAMFIDKGLSKNIYISLPKILCCFDYILLNNILSFLNFESISKMSTFFVCINEEYTQINENYKDKYKSLPTTPINCDNNKNNGDNKKDIKVHITALDLECINNREKFITINLQKLIIHVQDIVIVECDIKSIVDNRAISYKKRNFISKKMFSHKNLSYVKFKLIVNMKERNIELNFEDARIVFLMRVIMDCVEYFYKIIFDDLIFKKVHNKEYGEVIKTLNTLIENAKQNKPDKEINIINNNNDNNIINNNINTPINVTPRRSVFFQALLQSKRRLSNFHLQKLQSTGNISTFNNIKNELPFSTNNVSFITRNTGFQVQPMLRRHSQVFKSFIKNPKTFTTQKETKKKLSLSIYVRNSEISCCMNSLKEDDILLTFREVEFHMNIPKLTQSTLIDVFEYMKKLCHKNINDISKSYSFTNIDYYVTVKDLKLKKIIEKTSNNNYKSIEIGSLFNPKFNQSSQPYELSHLSHRNNNNNATEHLSEEQKKLQMFQKDFGDLVILFQTDKHKEVLSTMKICVIAPYIKLKMYIDIYEEILRVVFENLNENRTIISNGTKTQKEYFKCFIHNNNNTSEKEILKQFLISQDIIFMNADAFVSLYYYPSYCTNHKLENKQIKTHIQDNSEIKCDFGDKHPHIELDKVTEIKLKGLYTLMRFYLNTHKFIHCSLTDLHITLNPNMAAFSQYTSNDLVKINSNTTLNEINNTFICMKCDMNTSKYSPMKVTLDLNCFDINYYPLPFTILTRFFGKYFLYYKNKRVKNVINIETIKKNKRDMIFNINNLTCYINSMKDEDNGSCFNNNEIVLNLNIGVVMRNKGHSTIGPFKSLNKYMLELKNGILNVKNEQNEKRSFQFMDGFNMQIKQFSKCDFPWQEIDRFSYMFIQYGHDNDYHKMQDKEDIEFENEHENEHEEMHININTEHNNTNDNNDIGNINVCVNHPNEFKKYLLQYKFKESVEVNNERNNEYNKDANSDNNNNNNIINVNENILSQTTKCIGDLKSEENTSLTGEHSRNGNYSNGRFILRRKNAYNNNNNFNVDNNNNTTTNKIIKLSLNIGQVLQILKIWNDINKNYNDNAKLVLHSLNILTKLNTIQYQNAMAIYLSEIDLRICDSQFNIQLFRILIRQFMFISTNHPDNVFINNALVNLSKKYGISTDQNDINNSIINSVRLNTNPNNGTFIHNTNNNNENGLTTVIKTDNNNNNTYSEVFNNEMYVKLLLRVQYHNSSNSKKRSSQSNNNNNNNHLNNINNINNNDNHSNRMELIEDTTSNFWEPFIEPLPLKYTSLTSKENIYTKIEILSLRQTYDGLRNLCRQTKFHSLNINFNERLLENINAFKKDYDRANELMKSTQNNEMIIIQPNTTTKKLTVLNLTEYKMKIETNSNLIKDEHNNNYIYNDNDYDNNLLTSNCNSNCSNIEYSNNKVIYYYDESKKTINDKEEITVTFSDSDIIRKESRMNFNSNSMIHNNNNINKQTYNIERSSKYFYIFYNKEHITNNNANNNTNNNLIDNVPSSKEQREELKKNFDNKASILLNGEQFLVCEVEINREGNEKLVTFRSNEGIRNELDFAVTIKLILKDKLKRNDLTFTLKPNHFFFIPPYYLDNIKEIQFKPSMQGNSLLKFGTDSYPYSEMAFRNDDEVFIARCPIKEIRSFSGETQQERPFNDHIVFAIIKRRIKIENEFLDDAIKDKVEFVKNYQKYNVNKHKDIKISNLIADVNYVLAPIMRFYNYLPRTITITKLIPKDYNHKKPVDKPKPIDDYLDVENYFKYEREIYLRNNDNDSVDNNNNNNNGNNNNNSKQMLYMDLQQCDYETFKRKRKNKKYRNHFHDEKENEKEKKITIKPDDYVSIYEPFILSEKGQNYLHFKVSFENNYYISNNCNNNNNDSPLVNYKNNNKDKDSNSSQNEQIQLQPQQPLLQHKNNNEIEFKFKPFYFGAIMKTFKENENNINTIYELPKIIKDNNQTVKSSHSRNYFVNFIDINEHHVFNSYFYCPFLFINCSDMNIDIRYKDNKNKKTLLCKSYTKHRNELLNNNNNNNRNDKSNTNMNMNVNSDDIDINRVVMFNPTPNNHFEFELGNVTIENKQQQHNNNVYINHKNTITDTNTGRSSVQKIANDNNDNNKKKHKQNHHHQQHHRKDNNLIYLESQWKKIQILDISKFGGITIDLTSKKATNQNKHTNNNNILRSNSLHNNNTNNNNNNVHMDSITQSHNHLSTSKNKRKKSIPVEEIDKRLTFSLQMKLLPKYSTLIFITASVYIVNNTQKDIYVYHLPSSKNLSIKSSTLKVETITKYHQLIDYYPYVQLSFEDKYNSNDKVNFSGLINFTLDELKNKEFYIALGDPHKEPLLCCKIFEEKGFKFVVITQNENINDYPYVIINKLKTPISFKQKENTYDNTSTKAINDKYNEINIIYNHLEKDIGIEKKITPHLLKELYDPYTNTTSTTSQTLIPLNTINTNINSNYNVQALHHNNNQINENKMYYTWEEPLLYDKDKNTNILELKLFGAKFEIDPQEIKKDDTFESRVPLTSSKDYLDNIIDFSVLKGKIRIVDEKNEYTYELYKHALVLKRIDEEKAIIIFEFHDMNLICERKYNGNFTMKTGTKEYEMYCVSIDETNDLVEKMNIFTRRAKLFAKEFVIKKYAKDKCIYIEVTQKGNIKDDLITNTRTHLYFSIENIGISLMMQDNEFIYIWFNKVYTYIQQEHQTDKSVLYKQILCKVKDYQIDNYTSPAHYPVILSPLSVKTYDKSNKDFFNFVLVINNFQTTADLYQVDLIYVNMFPIDLRFESNFLQNVITFKSKIEACFDNPLSHKHKSISDYVNEIDKFNFKETDHQLSNSNPSKTRIHVKQICIDDIKICFSLKFDSIDLFLETSSFLFLKPLIEELGLHILSLDSSIFSFANYTKVNVYQSTNDFMDSIVSFLFQQFISELIKALGGISSVTSMQIVESLNNNILANMKSNRNSLDKYRTKKGIKDFYRSGYENISAVVGGLFMLAYKMMATVGRVIVSFTFDEKYKNKRSYEINKSVKGLASGLSISLRLLLIALLYMFTQFYHVPKKYYKTIHIALACLLSAVIILVGLVWKPICGVFDCVTKGLETIGVTINDIMADRVKTYARFPRAISENCLSEYNSTEAFAAFIKRCIGGNKDTSKSEENCMAIPGKYKGRSVIVLITLERMLTVEYGVEFSFKEVLLLHYSEVEVYGERDEKRVDRKENYIWFKKKDKERIIEVRKRRKGCCSFYRLTYEIEIIKMKDGNELASKYDDFVFRIINSKNKINED